MDETPETWAGGMFAPPDDQAPEDWHGGMFAPRPDQVAAEEDQREKQKSVADVFEQEGKKHAATFLQEGKLTQPDITGRLATDAPWMSPEERAATQSRFESGLPTLRKQAQFERSYKTVEAERADKTDEQKSLDQGAYVLKRYPVVGSLTGLATAGVKYQAAKRMEAGTDTEMDRRTIAHMVLDQKEEQARNPTGFDKFLDTASYLPAFVTEWSMLGGVGGVSRKLATEALAKGYSKAGTTFLEDAAAKAATGRALSVAERLALASVGAPAEGLARTIARPDVLAKKTLEGSAPQVTPDEQGGYQITPGKPLTTEAANALRGQFIENAVFSAGGPFEAKAGEKFIPRVLKGWGQGVLSAEASQELQHLGAGAPQGSALHRFAFAKDDKERQEALTDFGAQVAAFGGIEAAMHTYGRVKELAAGQKAKGLRPDPEDIYRKIAESEAPNWSRDDALREKAAVAPEAPPEAAPQPPAPPPVAEAPPAEVKPAEPQAAPPPTSGAPAPGASKYDEAITGRTSLLGTGNMPRKAKLVDGSVVHVAGGDIGGEYLTSTGDVIAADIIKEWQDSKGNTLWKRSEKPQAAPSVSVEPGAGVKELAPGETTTDQGVKKQYQTQEESGNAIIASKQMTRTELKQFEKEVRQAKSKADPKAEVAKVLDTYESDTPEETAALARHAELIQPLSKGKKAPPPAPEPVKPPEPKEGIEGGMEDFMRKVNMKRDPAEIEAEKARARAIFEPAKPPEAPAGKASPTEMIYDAIDKDGQGGMARMDKVREASSLKGADFDKHILKLAEEGKIILHRADQPIIFPPEMRAKFVKDPETGDLYLAAGFRDGKRPARTAEAPAKMSAAELYRRLEAKEPIPGLTDAQAHDLRERHLDENQSLEAIGMKRGIKQSSARESVRQSLEKAHQKLRDIVDDHEHTARLLPVGEEDLHGAIEEMLKEEQTTPGHAVNRGELGFTKEEAAAHKKPQTPLDPYEIEQKALSQLAKEMMKRERFWEKLSNKRELTPEEEEKYRAEKQAFVDRSAAIHSETLRRSRENAPGEAAPAARGAPEPAAGRGGEPAGQAPEAAKVEGPQGAAPADTGHPPGESAAAGPAGEPAAKPRGRKPGPGGGLKKPVSEADYADVRNRGLELTTLWKEETDPKAKASLEKELVALGAKKIGTEGGKTKYDGQYHESSDPVSEGDSVRVENPGWVWEDEKRQYLLSPAEVVKETNERAGFGSPLTEAERSKGMIGGGQADAGGVARPKRLTALANAQVDKERQERGLPPIMSEARQSNPESWDKAMEMLDRDPMAGAKLVEELASGQKKTTTVEENALLLHRKVALANEHDRAVHDLLAVFTPRIADQNAADIERLTAVEQELSRQIDQLDEVANKSGTEWGRAGQFRKQLAAEDFTLSGMLQRAIAAKGGDITPEERIQLMQQVTKLHDRIKELEGKLQETEGKVRQGKAGAKELVRDRGSVEDAKGEYKKLNNESRKQREPMSSKASDWLKAIRVNSLISGIGTLIKVVAASASRLVTTPLEEAAGSAIRKIPGLSKIAAGAPREGRGFNWKTEAKSFASFWSKGFADAWRTARTGKSELDSAHGKQGEPGSWLNLQFRIHDAIKAPAVRAEYTRSFLQRMDFYASRGEDVSSPEALLRISTEAYVRSQEAKFRQQNWLVDMVNSALKINPKDNLLAKTTKTGGKLVVPIMRIPTNLVFETGTHIFGTATGSVQAINAYRRGIENLKPHEADAIMRQFKKGSLGVAMLLLGYFKPDMFGGYYQEDEKKEKGEPGFGEAKVGGVTIPTAFQHNPMMQVAQFGATIRKVQDKQAPGKLFGVKKGPIEGVAAGVTGLASEIPLIREATDVEKMVNAHSRGAAFGELAKSFLVPQLFQWLAGQMDLPEDQHVPFGHPNRRKPEDFLETLETGIPGLRQNVPLKN